MKRLRFFRTPTCTSDAFEGSCVGDQGKKWLVAGGYKSGARSSLAHSRGGGALLTGISSAEKWRREMEIRPWRKTGSLLFRPPVKRSLGWETTWRIRNECVRVTLWIISAVFPSVIYYPCQLTTDKHITRLPVTISPPIIHFMTPFMFGDKMTPIV